MSEELSLYLHFPFCRSKCVYCDFNSRPLRDGDELDAYLAALVGEARRRAMPARRVVSIYLGGGTPSLLGERQLAAVLEEVRRSFAVDRTAEITLEANPGTVSAEAARAWAELGVNRVSLGVQAFQDRLLALLGRAHGVREVASSVEALRRAGIANLNLDLIYQLPGQSLEDWRESLRRAVDLAPEHLSAYPLQVEKGTPLAVLVRRGLALPSEEEGLRMERELVETARRAGLERYEIANFARPGRQCRHNRRYWERLDYLGLGAGAHSCLGERRFWNVRSPDAYIRRAAAGKSPRGGGERLSPGMRRSEVAILGLRLTEGLSLAVFRERCGMELEQAFPGVTRRLGAVGLAVCRDGRLRLSRRGLSLANRAFAEFLP